MGTSVIRSNFLEKVVQLSLYSRDPPTVILFLGLVLSTAQGFEVTSFKADPEKPDKDEKVTLTATPDGNWKTCIIKMGPSDICETKLEGEELKGLGKKQEDKYECTGKKNGICGITVFKNQGGKFEVKMTGADDTEVSKTLELKAEANGAGIPQIGMAVWIQLASTFALYKMAF